MPIPAQRDPDVTGRLLTEWLAAKLPAASDLALSRPTPPTATGFSSDTLIFDATWKEHGEAQARAFVARARPTGYAVFPEYDIGQQYRVVRILGERTDVPVPPVYWFEGDESVLGAPFYVMGKVEGQIPGDNPPYTMEGFLLDASPEQRACLWWSGIDALARIHRLDWRALGFDLLDRPEHGPAGLGQQLGYYAKYLEWAARGMSQPIAEAAFDWLRANRPEEPEPLGLCWGDARIGNMVFADFRCAAVLDWEMVTLGNPVQDLAWWLFLHRHHTDGIGVASPPGIPGRAETVARYEELVGRDASHLDYYEVFAGFRFAVIMMRVAQMMIEYEVIPADSTLETDNTVTQLLAGMLGLPAPS